MTALAATLVVHLADLEVRVRLAPSWAPRVRGSDSAALEALLQLLLILRNLLSRLAHDERL
jgi:hypothetical protein